MVFKVSGFAKEDLVLNKNEFQVLTALASHRIANQRSLASISELSLGTVNTTLKALAEKGYVDAFELTPRGVQALKPYKVENAVIMAAGLSSRFAPISYEKPKGLLSVRGEVLIERQIKQLHAAGITDITVVVGYKKEFFFYLEDKFGVTIVVNSEYAKRNNNSSLMAVREKLGNTYVCSSDDYFTQNPFESYVYQAYYATEFRDGLTKEWCIQESAQGRIKGVTIGGADSWIMLGHVYFDRAFSEKFVEILEREYDAPSTADKLWEEIYIDHVKELFMVTRHYQQGVIFEFDSLDELQSFDPYFLKNVDSEAFDNIERVLGCDRGDVSDIYPLKQGLTNLSCHFRVGDKQYVYRYPGVGTDELISRKDEEQAQRIAQELGLDDTFIFEDPQKGWKISRFIPDCRNLDPHDDADLARAMAMARDLHHSGKTIGNKYDFFAESKRYTALLGADADAIPGFAEMARRVERVHDAYVEEGGLECLCHNDFFHLNFLIDGNDKAFLIDWEYAGMADEAQDFGTFTVCCELSEEEAERALAFYVQGEPTDEQRRHHWAAVCFAGWCWYVWSLYKEAQGECVGEWLYIYYRYAKRYLDKAAALYALKDKED